MRAKVLIMENFVTSQKRMRAVDGKQEIYLEWPKRRRRQDFYDVPYYYTLPPLPPRVQRTDPDSEIYDFISKKNMECETSFSIAVEGDIPCHRISFTLGQSNVENGDAPSTGSGVIDTTDAEVSQNTVAENDAMQNPHTFNESAEVQENENLARAANINFENKAVAKESIIFGTEALGLQENQDKVAADEGVIQANTLQEENMTQLCEETVHVQMQENALYQPSTNFVLFANPAYGTDIAIAPEIPTEDNIAYQRTCSSQQGSNSDDINISSSGLASDSALPQ